MTQGLQWKSVIQVCFRDHRGGVPGTLFTLLLISMMLLANSKSTASDITFAVDQNIGLLRISAISASDQVSATSDTAEMAVDGDLRTKWAAPGMAQWITVDLGIPQQVSMAKISFTSYIWGKIYTFNIATSLDGINWTNAVTAAESVPVQWTETTFPPINARYVRVTLNSAYLPNPTMSKDSEINEIEIYGSHIPPVLIGVPAVTVSDYQITTGEVAENALDGDINTKWSAAGIPNWMTLDLGTSQLVSMAKISFASYQWGKTYTFDIATSLDGINWTETVAATESTPDLQWTEVTFTPINARYVRVTLNSARLEDGSLDLRYSEINEIELYGLDTTTITPAATLTLSWAPDMTGNVLGYLIYYGPTPATADVEITNLPVNTAGFDPLAPSQQYDPYTELGLLPGDNVCFRLKAYNDNDASPWSEAICGGV